MVDPGRVLVVHHVAVQRVEHLGTPGRDSQAGQPAGSWGFSGSKCMLQMFPLLQTFHWTDGTLVLFNLWGILAFPVFVPLSSYLLSTSLRASVLLASACLFLGSTVRCRTKRKLSPCVGVTPSHACSLQMSPALDPLPGRVRGHGSPGRHPQRHRGAHRHVRTHHGQWLSAVCRAHPGLIITRTVQISAAWFPPEERTRATSIGQMCNALGVGVSYLLAMAIVTSGDAEDSDAGETSYIPQIERSAEG